MAGFWPTPVEIGMSLFLIGLGVLVIPALAFFRGLRPKGLMGRIIWTIGSLVLGRYGLVQRETGQYGLYPVRRDEDDELYALVDGEEMPIDEEPENWARLGKQPFLVTYEKSERLFRDVISDVGEAMPDGGIDGQRGGYHSYVPDAGGEGYLIRVHRLVERLREAGGSRLADIAEEEGLREFGGDNEMSNIVMLVYVFLFALLGLSAGWFFVT